MRVFNLLAIALTLVLGPVVRGDGPLLRSGDRVAWLGGTFIERMQASGAVEAEIQCRRPDWQLTFRNLGWSGDDVHGIARKRFDGPEDGFKRLLSDVEIAAPTVVLIAYGFAEASDGDEAVGRFEPGLRRLIGALATPQRRVILVAPFAMPGYRVDGYADSIGTCRAIVERVGDQTKTPVIKIDWQPQSDELTTDGLLPSSSGYAKFATLITDTLVGGQRCAGPSTALRELIVEKNELFFHRYRPQNETYLFLFRKHEQGNNAVEIPQFDPLIEQADAAIWQAAAGESTVETRR